MGTKYHIEERLFLNRDKDMPGFIIGIVEDTTYLPDDHDKARKGGYIELKLGDCETKVSFYFAMGSTLTRSDSLYKIRRMAKVINAVKDAIEKEVEAIQKRPKLKKKQNK